MDENYIKELWNWTTQQDPTFTDRYTFDSWKEKLGTNEEYRQQFHSWVSSIDNSFSERRPLNQWTELVKKKDQPKQDTASASADGSSDSQESNKIDSSLLSQHSDEDIKALFKMLESKNLPSQEKTANIEQDKTPTTTTSSQKLNDRKALKGPKTFSQNITSDIEKRQLFNMIKDTRDEAEISKEQEVIKSLPTEQQERLELLKKKAAGNEKTLLELTQYPPDIFNLTQDQANEEYEKTLQLKTAEFDVLQRTKGEAVTQKPTKKTINKPQQKYDPSLFKYNNEVIEALQKQGNERDLFIYTSSLDRAERLNEELKDLEKKSTNPLVNQELIFKTPGAGTLAPFDPKGKLADVVEQSKEYDKLLNLRNDIYKNLWNAQGIERANTIDPELGAQDTVDYFLDIVDDVVSLKGNEASIVSQSNSGLNQYGFNFIGSGGWFNDKMIVNSANGKSIEIELPNSSDDLRNFLEKNRRTSEIQYLKDAKVTSGSRAVLKKEKRLVKKEDVERELQMFQDRTTVYNKKTQAFVKEEAQFSNEVDAWNRKFEVEGETPELVAQREELQEKEKEITATRNKLIEYEDSFKNEGEELDRMAGAYYLADADNGSFLGATASHIKEGVGSIAADAVYLGLTIPYLIDKGINFLGGGNFHILPANMLIDNYSEKFKEKAEEMGYNPSSMSEEDTDKVNTALRENALQTELYGEYQEPNPYSTYTNQVLGGRQGGVLNEIREGIRNAYGEMSSREYDKEFTESFWGQVWAGTMSSIPAILTMVASAPAAATKATVKTGLKETLKRGAVKAKGLVNPKRQWAMIMQTQDMVNQEMNANPELRNVPEEEKFVLGSIIGLTTGVLEDLGLTNMINSKGFVNGLILRGLGKSGATSSAKTFQQVVREDVKNMIARMGLTAGAGFAAEFETGALQEVADVGIKELYDAVKGKDYFDNPAMISAEFINEVLYAGVSEGAGSLILGLPNIMSSRKRGNNFTEIDDATWNLYTNIKDEPFFLEIQKDKLEDEVKKGRLSASEARSIYNTYKNVTQAFEEIPKNLKRKEQQEALGLIINRKQLEDKKRDKNPLLTKQEDAAIAEIDKRLAGIGEVSAKRFKTKQDAIQKQSTGEVDANQQATDAQAVETGTSTTESQELTGEELQDQETDAVLEEVTDEVFEEFTNTGNVSEGVINTIVNKVKAGEKLTSQEEAIRQDKSSEVEIKLKESPVVEETITEKQPTFESVSESVSINNPTKKELSKPERILLGKAERAIKAVKKIMPNLKIVVHESDKAYAEGTPIDLDKNGKEIPKTLGESGSFDGKNTIHVNLETANISTVPHEILHAIMVNKTKSDKVAQVVSEKMMNSIRKSLPPGNELRVYLDKYLEKYEDKGIHNEEQLAELLGRMAIEYKTLTAPQKSKLMQIINKILKAIGIKLPGSFTKSDEDVIRMFNTLSTKLRTGEEVLEEDVKLVEDEAYTVSEKLKIKEDAKFKPRDVRKQKNIYSGVDFATEIPTLSLKDFVNRVDGNVYAVTSDATGLGYDSQGDKIDGGFGYTSITENVDGDVGFASLDMDTVRQLYGKVEGKPGDKVGILIMIQKPSATLGNYYGAKFLGRGLQQLQKESPNTYDQVASSLINVIQGNKTIQDSFADTKKDLSQDRLINLIMNPNKYSELEFAKEFIKDTTFESRRIIVQSVVPKTPTTRTNKNTPIGKVKLQEAGYSLSSFLEEYGDNRLLSKKIMDSDQGGFIVGGFEMVIPDNVDEAIKEVEKRGLTHPQFNGKIPSNGNNFIFDGLYPINENFQGFAKPNVGIVKDTRSELDKIVNRKFKNNLNAYQKKFLEGPKKVNKKDLHYTHLKEPYKIKIKEEIGKTRPELLEDIPAELVSKVASGKGMVLKERIPYDTKFAKLSPRQKRAQIIGPSAEISGEIQDAYIVAKSLYDIRDKYKDNKDLLSFVDSDPEIKKNIKATDTFDPKRIPFDLKSPTEIFYATGWIRGEDGKYRYEIPSGTLRKDRIEKLKGKNLKAFRMNGVPLKDIFDAPELFKFYPELKDLTVKSVNFKESTRGGYTPLVPGETIKEDGLISLNERFFNDGYSVSIEEVPTYKGTDYTMIASDEMLRLTLIHEIQHAIQNIEGFAKGTNSKDVFYKIQEEYGKEFTDMLRVMATQMRVANDLVSLFEYIPAPVFSGKVKDIVDFKSDSIGEYIIKILNLSKDSDLYNKMEGKVSDFYLKRGGERLKKEYEDKKPTVYSNQITSAISNLYEEINGKPLSKKEILDGSPKAIDFINEKIFLPLNAFIKLDIVNPNDKSSIYKAFSEVESKNAKIKEKYFTPYQLYTYTYGEVEARNAAKRELIIKDLGRQAEKIVKAEMMGKEVPQEVYDKYEKALDFLRQPFINTEDIPQHEKKWILPSPKIGRPKRKVRKQLAPMDATMQDLIAWGRARNLPDVQIRELLIERNMGTVKEINKALREVVEYMAMPREMADILGGVKQGEKLFKEVMEEFYSQTMEVRDVSESEKARRKRAEEVMKDTPKLYEGQTLDPKVAEKTKGMKLVTVQSIIGSPRRFQRVWIKTPAQRREILQKIIDKNPIYQKQPDFTQAQIKSVLDRTLNSTANPSVEQQIKALKDLLKAVRNKERTIEEYRKELKNIINNTLPTVRNVNNFNRLNRLLISASKVNEKNIIGESDKVTKIINEIRAQERNERKERIVKLIRAKAKAKAGVDADTQGFFQSLQKILNIFNEDNVENELNAFKTRLEDTEIESIVLKYLNKESLTSEERNIMFDDYAYELLKDFDTKSVEELDSLFDDLSLLKKEGISRFKTNREKRISKYQLLQAQVDKQIAQDYKFLINEDGNFLDEEEIIARREEIREAFRNTELIKGTNLWIQEVWRAKVKAKASWFKQYLGSMQTLTNSFDSRAKGNNFFTDNVYQKLRDMRDKFLDGEQKQTTTINDIAASIKGIKTGESKGKRILKAVRAKELSPYGQIVEYLAGKNIVFTVSYTDADGRTLTRKESLTRDQALRVYALSKNEVQRDKLMRGKDSKGKGTFYSEENLKYIEEELSRVSDGILIEFADKVVSYLSNQYFDEINDVYRESNDSNLNRIENYFPTKTYETSYNQKDVMGQNFHRIFSAESAPALKSRIDTKGRINIKEYSFTSELFNHLEQMEKFKAYALGVKELNAIFNFTSVKTLMRASRLNKLMDIMIKADLVPDQVGLNHFGKTWLSRAFRTFTSYALSFKIWQIPKQASSFINAYEDYDSGIKTGNIPWLSDAAKEAVDVVGFMYDLGATVLGLSGELMSGGLKNKINKQLDKTGLNIKIGDGPLTKAYKISPTFRDRVQQSMSNDMWGLESGQKVRRDRQGIEYTPKLTRIKRKYIKGFRTVGNSPTMIGDFLGVMGYMVNYRADIRRGMSEEEALKKFNRYEATQQTRGTTEKNFLQLNSNDVTRMFTMFGSTLFLQMNKVVQAAKNISEATGQGIMPKKKDVRSLLINGAFANLFFSLASRALQYASDDDEDQIEALKDMKKTLIGLNLLKQLPLLGDAVAYYEHKGSGKRYSPDPIVNPYLSLVQKMYYNIEEKNWEKMTKEVWGMFAGIDADPFIGMYNWLIANDSMPVDKYEALGIAKSYRPTEKEEETEVKKPVSAIRPTRDQLIKQEAKEKLELEKKSRDRSAWELFFDIDTSILPLYEEEKKERKAAEKAEDKAKIEENIRPKRMTRTQMIRKEEAEEYKRLKEEAKEKKKKLRRFY